MKPKLLLCLALVLNGYCRAALVYSLASDEGRGVVSTNINLKISGRIYRVGLTNLVSDQFLSVAKANGNFSGDRFDNEIPEALRIAEQLPQVKKQDYEPRLLDISPMLFVAVWLHGRSDDIIIPLPPTFERWKAYQPYSESQIIKILAPEAKRDEERRAKLNQQRQHDQDAYAKAMTDYEKAHGDKCGFISFSGMSSLFENPAPDVHIFTLLGKSSECGKVSYKVKVTYERHFDGVKEVEILEKSAAKSP